MSPRLVWILTPVIALAAVLPAAAQDVERLAMAAVRLSTDAALARSCTRIGYVSDNDLRDLRRKVVRLGGDTAILSFRSDDLRVIQAEVFRCPPARVPAPPPPPPPPPPPVTPSR
jgi:hypothetical protein